MRELGVEDSTSVIQGLVKSGYAVFAFDQIGFGTRVEEGTHFYRKHPHWSKMGKMVADTSAVAEMLANMEDIDPDRIYALGYALGATVGLYAAALDERIAGVVSVCGFTPMRLDSVDMGTEGIRASSLTNHAGSPTTSTKSWPPSRRDPSSSWHPHGIATPPSKR